MATYKVIQDIEAEDKFLGPLTLKQFIFAAITVVCLYLSFFFVTKHIWYMALPLLPIMLVGGFLAFPWGRDQPTETWLLAKLRFMVKPHLRVWDQTGVLEQVTITAPKKQDPMFFSDNLSQNEVRSRLRALADTIDSRGWAVKNSSLNMVTAPGYAPALPSSDRLVDVAATSVAPTADVAEADDIMDEHSNPVAQNFSRMIQKSEQTHRQATLKKMDDIRGGNLPAPVTTGASSGSRDDFWFMNQPSGPAPAGYTTFDISSQADTPDPSAHLSTPEQALLNRIHKDQNHVLPSISHIKSDKPASSQKSTGQGHITDNAQPVVPPDPSLMQLADNDDLSVATIAREANKKPEPPADEVVINLH